MSEEIIDLREQFSRICRLLHTLHHYRKHGPAGDPHRGQGRVLALLKLRPEISQKELSYLLDIRQQSLGELLAKLENKGLIERTLSESDNRAVNIRLTEAGSSVIAKQDEDEFELFQELNREEQAALSGYLERIITGMEERFGDVMPGCAGKAGPFHHGRHRHGFPHDEADADVGRHGRQRHHCGDKQHCGQERGKGHGRCHGHGMMEGDRGKRCVDDCEE